MSQLQLFLDGLYQNYHQPKYLYSDPLEFVHRYSEPLDQEAVALVAALLAYGNVKQIRRSVQAALERMEKLSTSPSDFVLKLQTTRGLRASYLAFDGFVHRFNRGEDLVLLLKLLSRSWRQFGSLGSHFVSYLSPDDEDISGALNSLIRDWRKWAGPEAPNSFGYLLTAPEDGSCCKRWCMFLRWMGRVESSSEGKLDLGLWASGGGLAGTFPKGRALKASQLILPLDTHTGRISRHLGLTKRKSMNWLAATEVTRVLRSCDPEDPTRYDFALSRLGILDLVKYE